MEMPVSAKSYIWRQEHKLTWQRHQSQAADIWMERKTLYPLVVNSPCCPTVQRPNPQQTKFQSNWHIRETTGAKTVLLILLSCLLIQRLFTRKLHKKILYSTKNSKNLSNKTMKNYHAVRGLSTANCDTLLKHFHISQDLQQLAKKYNKSMHQYINNTTDIFHTQQINSPKKVQ